MASYLMVFAIEIVIAFLIYLLLRKFTNGKHLPWLVIAALLIGYTCGWVSAYRITAAQTLTVLYVGTNRVYEQEHGASIPTDEWVRLAEEWQNNPATPPLLYKSSALHAFWPFIIVTLMLSIFARKQAR